MFYVIDGRHRLWAANKRDVKRMRCNVTDNKGREALRVIDTEQLEPDPDVQIEFAFKPALAERIAEDFDERKLGVLAVTPKGVSNGEITKKQKAEIKLGLDRDRRNVQPLESFKVELIAGDFEAQEINRIVLAHGYDIGAVSVNVATTRISAIQTLRQIHRIKGRLDRVMKFNEATWYGDVGANTRAWLIALKMVVDEDCDLGLSENAYERLRAINPAQLIREAQGKIAVGGYTSSIPNPVATYTADKIMKTTRKRRKSWDQKNGEKPKEEANGEK